jgi:hypothetical protein
MEEESSTGNPATPAPTVEPTTSRPASTEETGK